MKVVIYFRDQTWRPEELQTSSVAQVRLPSSYT